MLNSGLELGRPALDISASNRWKCFVQIHPRSDLRLCGFTSFYVCTAINVAHLSKEPPYCFYPRFYDKCGFFFSSTSAMITTVLVENCLYFLAHTNNLVTCD